MCAFSLTSMTGSFYFSSDKEIFVEENGGGLGPAADLSVGELLASQV